MHVNRIKLISLVTLILLIVACKFPRNEIEDFQINLNGNLINTLVDIQFVTEDTLAVEKIAFSISGKNSDDIFDLEGKTNFNAEGGRISLILSPTAFPTPDNPWVFVIEAEKEGYLPIRESVFLFNNKQKVSLKYTFRKATTLPIGTDYKAIPLNFLGKKRIDTVSFDFTRGDGVQFIIKYPTAGLTFIRKSLLKFRNNNVSLPLNSLLQDTSIYLSDTGNLSIPPISQFLFKYNKFPNEQKVSCPTLSITTGTNLEKTRIGFKKPNLIAEFEDKITPDTIALGNVRANVVSNSTFYESGYFDETGNLVEGYNLFPNAIGFPQIYFYDAKSGNPIEPYYPNGIGGVIIEAIVPSNNYKIFMEGIDYSTTSDAYFQTKRIVGPQQSIFEPTSGGKYKITLFDNLLSGRFFLFTNSEVSCGFSTVDVNYPNIPLNLGFIGNINIKNTKLDITYAIDFTKPIASIRVPAFGSEISTIKMDVDHPVNRCQSNPILFNGDIGTANLCNFTQSNLNLNASYNPAAFLSTINGYSPLLAKATITCPSGNFVIPPTIVLNIWQLGCKTENVITLEGGEFYSPNMIENNKTYIVRYDKMSSSGKPSKIYDTLEFNTAFPEIDIVDKKTGYWTGKLKYSPTTGFVMEVIFDNKKMKYKIPNCN